MNTIPLSAMAPPLNLLIAYAVILIACLITGRTQLGLSLTFVFVFYLGFIYNYELINDLIEGSMGYTIGYFASGFVLLGLTITSFFRKNY